MKNREKIKVARTFNKKIKEEQLVIGKADKGSSIAITKKEGSEA